MNGSIKDHAVRLALAAGIESPEAIVYEQGDKPRPAWTYFVRAAQEEQAVAAKPVVPVNLGAAPRSKGEPVGPVIRGEHDAATIEQLHRCLDHDDAVAGALCADGHLGYSQPVGAAIAYREHISVSGVGYDIACFTGDTRIFTLDGKTPTLAELDGQDVAVLSCDKAGKPVPAWGRCRKTREMASLVRVVLDNGESIRCTPDHPFMLRDGSYCRADGLVPGQSLMPLYQTKDRDGYVLVRNNATKRLMRLHWMVYRAGMTAPAPNLDGDELVIHHRNFIRADNSPGNLIPMGKVAHDIMHAAMRDRSHFNSPDFHKNRIEGIKKFWATARENQEFMGRRKNTAKSNLRPYLNGEKGDFRNDVKGNGIRGSSYLRRFNENPEVIRRVSARSKVVITCPLCGLATRGPVGFAKHARSRHPTEAAVAGISLPWRPGKPSFLERFVAAANNHKVLSVEALPEREDVFCLEVPGLNNFGLAAGVFVHNCGLKAVRTDLVFGDLKHMADAIMDRVASEISFGVGRTNAEPVEHPLFERDAPLWEEAGAMPLKRLAASSFGTCGGGNHFVDLLREVGGEGDEDAQPVWVMVHFGSRGLGHKLATKYLQLGGGKDSINDRPTLLHQDTDLGRAYIAAMTLAGEYAYAGRDWVVARVLSILGAQETFAVHNHHNFASREDVGGEPAWVVRKGCTAAMPGQLGAIGGSMGDDAVIVEGVEHPEMPGLLRSTVHGAGRLYSRRKAKEAFSREEMERWLVRRGVHLRGADLDESPMAYRRLSEVMAHHQGTVKILHTLRPFGVAMADKSTKDPWKD